MLSIIIFLIFPIFLLNLLFPQSIFAAEPKYSLSHDMTYVFSKSGRAKIVQKTVLTNNTSTFQPKSMEIKTGLIDVFNVQASDSRGTVLVTQTNVSGQAVLTFLLRPAMAGIGQSATWTLSYETDSLMQKLGNTFVITIPRPNNTDLIKNYLVTVDYSALGIPFFASPKQITPNHWIYDQIKDSGIQLLFLPDSQKQYYLVDTKYSLSNNKLYPTYIEIPLPHDSYGQSVSIVDLTPPPIDVRLTSTDEWIARYYLAPNSKHIIEGNFLVETFPVSRQENLLEKNIKDVLSEIEKPFENCQQAVSFLQKKLNDLGIQTRQVSGVLFPTRNSLHCWLEYHDLSNNSWVPIDPYLQFVTHGFDYYSQWDVFHISIAKTISSLSQIVVKPVVEGVVFPQSAKISIQSDIPKNVISGMPFQGKLIVTNSGPVQAKNLDVEILSNKDILRQKKYNIDLLPPLGNKEISVNFSPVAWNFSGSSIISLHFNDQELSYTVEFIPIYKSKPILFTGGIVVAAISFITTKIARSLLFQKRKK